MLFFTLKHANFEEQCYHYLLGIQKGLNSRRNFGLPFDETFVGDDDFFS